MNPLGALGRSRKAAGALMLDTCEIVTIAGTTTDANANVIPTYSAPVYSGRCKLQQMRGAFPSTPSAGEHVWTLAPLELHLPVVGTENVAVDDLVRVLTSVDPDNVGRVFRVRSGDRKTFQSAIRFQVEEVAG